MVRIGSSVLHAVTGILAPRLCIGCDAVVPDGGTGVCDTCGPELARLVGRPYCARCGASTGPAQLPDNVCPQCLKGKALCDGLVRVSAYESLVERLVRLYKFHNRYDLEAPAVRLLAAKLGTADWLDRISVLVCVPTHWTHRSFRGEYFADRLARGVSQACGIRYEPVLKRTRGGPRQYELPSPAHRFENVKGAFGAVRGARLKGAAICVVDDVSTTGATLAEVRRTLKAAGAVKVYSAILAKGGWQ